MNLVVNLIIIIINNLIMLSVKNLKQKKLSKKLFNKLLKIFYIQEFINKQMYHFNLLAVYKIHSVFHIFLLKLYNCKLNDDSISEYFASELIDDE